MEQVAAPDDQAEGRERNAFAAFVDEADAADALRRARFLARGLDRGRDRVGFAAQRRDGLAVALDEPGARRGVMADELMAFHVRT